MKIHNKSWPNVTSKIISASSLAENIEIRLNGHQAAEYLDTCTNTNKNFPDVVLLDINMPIMNGFEVLDYCEQKGYSGKTRFIILTTSTHKKDKDTSAKYSDVVDYIEKPISEEKILSIIENISDFE